MSIRKYKSEKQPAREAVERFPLPRFPLPRFQRPRREMRIEPNTEGLSSVRFAVLNILFKFSTIPICRLFGTNIKAAIHMLTL